MEEEVASWKRMRDSIDLAPDDLPVESSSSKKKFKASPRCPPGGSKKRTSLLSSEEAEKLELLSWKERDSINFPPNPGDRDDWEKPRSRILPHLHRTISVESRGEGGRGGGESKAGKEEEEVEDKEEQDCACSDCRIVGSYNTRDPDKCVRTTCHENLLGKQTALTQFQTIWHGSYRGANAALSSASRHGSSLRGFGSISL